MKTTQNQTINGGEDARREALVSADWMAEHLNDPNWRACYPLWVFTLFALKDLRILNGGCDKWTPEADARLPKATTVRPGFFSPVEWAPASPKKALRN